MKRAGSVRVILLAISLSIAWNHTRSREPPENPRRPAIARLDLHALLRCPRERTCSRKPGLEAEYIQMNPAIQPQAVIGGNINFFPSLSTGISAAVSGLPLVVVLNFLQDDAVDARDHKRINKPQDLIGKKLASRASEPRRIIS